MNIQRTEQNHHLCRGCWYDLHMITSDTCPECGTWIKPILVPQNTIARSDAVLLRKIGSAQVLLLWAVLASVLGLFAMAVFAPLYLLATIFQIYCVVRLAGALGIHWGWRILIALAMLIPFISLLLLLSINSQATRTIQRLDGKVGLMGIRKADLPPKNILQPT